MKARNLRWAVCAVCLMTCLGTLTLWAAEGPNLGDQRVDHQQIVDEEMSLLDIRLAGLRIFTTPFNRHDGYGDGPVDPGDTTTPGGRPTLQGNGTFLRVNGLDAQTCLECHSQLSAATSPPTLGIGGVGGSNSNAMIAPTEIDPDDFPATDGKAEFNGRLANPPFIFGTGGVELLALEMTADLQQIKQAALANPGVTFDLTTKGVDFGSIVTDGGGSLDLSAVEGVDDDLVVKPFGRKGDISSVRDFDIGAMRFHFGMQPVEFAGDGVDADGDGVVNEITIGELSALSIFVVTADPPEQAPLTGAAVAGSSSFDSLGCVVCHKRSLGTDRTELPMRFPEITTQPFANEYYSIDLTADPTKFDENAAGGVTVPLFADLKRHDMGHELAEDFALADDQTNKEYTTARLWGIADTAPYLHDGRATTLTDAILMHGGESQDSRDAFASLSESEQDAVIDFLRTLRVPKKPLKQLLNKATSGGPAREREENATFQLPTDSRSSTTEPVRAVRQE
jgi:hypothetical protein